MSSIDDFALRPGEDEDTWRKRRAEETKKEFAHREEFLKNYRGRDLKYDQNTLKLQICALQNEMIDRFGEEYTADGDIDSRLPSYDEKLQLETKYAYLRTKSPQLFTKIVEKRYVSPEDLRIFLELHKQIESGKLTVYEASQALQMYNLKKKMNVDPLTGNSGVKIPNGNDKATTWDLMRASNSFADPDIYDD